VGSVNAATFNFTGNLANQTDVIQFDFSLASAGTNVTFWTNSFMNGVNFDPILAVWAQSGLDHRLVRQNDDNPTVGPGQTRFDSGLAFSSLAAGNYRLTLATFPNFASGSLLSQGFRFDGQSPSPQARGTFYSVNLSGVSSAQVLSPVPEPETYAMLLAGLGLIGFMARRRDNINV